MKIGIDASKILVQDKTGVEVYSYEIITRLSEIANKQKTHELILYTPKFIKNIYETLQVKQKVIPFPRLWTQVRLSIELFLHKIDALFVPSHVLPIYRPKNSIITIHDTAFRHFKKAYSFFQYHYLNWSTRFACKKAKKIIVPSEATSSDLKNIFHCKHEKITVIPHGFSNSVPKDVAEWKIKEFFSQFDLDENDSFILFIGRLETKKNLVHLIEAFSKFVKNFPTWKLILAGKRGVGFSEIFKKANEKNLWDNIIMPGYIEEEEKEWLYKKCKFFIFPSLFEGFGLPVLEAFAHNVPVIASDTSSLKEVCSDACMYINPSDTNDIADVMEKLAKSEAMKQNLIEKGQKQLKNFSWDKAASNTWKILTSET